MKQFPPNIIILPFPQAKQTIEHQWIALTFKLIVTWLAPWKTSQLKLTSFIKECMSSMCTACGLVHFTRMDLSNSFAWVVSIHQFILNRITEGILLDILYWVNQYSTQTTTRNIYNNIYIYFLDGRLCEVGAIRRGIRIVRQWGLDPSV